MDPSFDRPRPPPARPHRSDQGGSLQRRRDARQNSRQTEGPHRRRSRREPHQTRRHLRGVSTAAPPRVSAAALRVHPPPPLPASPLFPQEQAPKTFFCLAVPMSCTAPQHRRGTNTVYTALFQDAWCFISGVEGRLWAGWVSRQPMPEQPAYLTTPFRKYMFSRSFQAKEERNDRPRPLRALHNCCSQIGSPDFTGRLYCFGLPGREQYTPKQSQVSSVN